MNFRSLIILPALAALLFSCDESTTIGSSLLDDQVEIVVDSSFVVTGHSVELTSIRPRCIDQLLGAINLEGYGTITSSTVAQLLPTTQMDTANFKAENIDSVFFNLRYVPGAFIGDSIAPMGVTIYPLTRQLQDGISSDFDPAGYYDPNNILGKRTYNATELTNIVSSGARTVAVKLPTEFGRHLFTEFEKNPANFANGQVFADNVFPGVYIYNSFGSGRLMDITRSTITMHLRKIEYSESLGRLDTVDAEHEYLFVSPEVINNNIINVQLDPAIRERARQGQALMVAPGCYETELRLPVPEIIAAYKAGSAKMTVLNSVSLSIYADSLDTEAPVIMPKYALLVRADKRDSFFAENSLPDNETSFYAEFNSATGTYEFKQLGDYVKGLLEKETIEEADYTFRLCPVQVSFELDMSSYYTQNYIVSDVVQAFRNPSVAIIPLDKAKVKLTYSRQTSIR